MRHGRRERMASYLLALGSCPLLSLCSVCDSRGPRAFGFLSLGFSFHLAPLTCRRCASGQFCWSVCVQMDVRHRVVEPSLNLDKTDNKSKSTCPKKSLPEQQSSQFNVEPCSHDVIFFEFFFPHNIKTSSGAPVTTSSAPLPSPLLLSPSPSPHSFPLPPPPLLPTGRCQGNGEPEGQTWTEASRCKEKRSKLIKIGT